LAWKFSLAENSPATIRWIESLDQNEALQCAEVVAIYQDSSGGENWDSHNHVNRFGQSPCAFKGDRVRQSVLECTQATERFGQRATPTVYVETSSGNLAIAVPEFWQQFPKAITANKHEIAIELFPSSCSDLYELQGGEQKTHTTWLRFANS